MKCSKCGGSGKVPDEEEAAFNNQFFIETARKALLPFLEEVYEEMKEDNEKETEE